MQQAQITYYDSLIPGHVRNEPKAMPIALAEGLLQGLGYSPRYDGADVFDHYDGSKVAVISNPWLAYPSHNDVLYTV